MKFADIILPLALPKLYTYAVPENLYDDCKIGMRAVIQFGKKKMYTGIIAKLHDEQPAYKTKEIISLLDDYPIVRQSQLDLWNWIANYYLCTTGEIFKAALPSGLKLESETGLSIGRDSNDDILSDKQMQILASVKSDKKMTISKLQNNADFNVLPIVKKLVEEKYLSAHHRLKEKYKPKYETFLRLAQGMKKEEQLSEALKTLSRAKKQSELLMDFIYLTTYGSDKFDGLPPAEEFRKSDIIKHTECSTATIKSLVERRFLIEEKREIGRLNLSKEIENKSKTLNDGQLKALAEIKKAHQTKDVVLLHGVTASGKTEVYIKLIEEQIAAGKQILYLLPEIALTAQIINRLTHIFGNKVGVYHSKFNDAERVEIWTNLAQKKDKGYQIILGVRSSVLLPFDNLGLIIVDEEHENTYKQYAPAPRYNARDLAVVLAKMQGAKVLLGTATPSVESYFNVLQNKYALVEMFSRFGDIKMPEIIIGDIKDARRRKMMKSIFTPVLYEHIEQALKNKEQVILFQNRRGFSPFTECETCGYIPQCENCDVSLTYHKHNNQLVCHYCGYAEYGKKTCKACGDTAMTTRGYGTEKIEQEVSELFPQARVARMDTDTTRSRTAYHKMISDFESGKTNILIGTQMVSKGLDFDNVSIVGIMNADNMLNFPDFRAFERSFQLMTQVSGRAGRRQKQGKVIIQTTNKDNCVIQNVVKNDFQSLLNAQLSERKQFKYPPYYRLVQLSVKHKYSNVTDAAAKLLAEQLRQVFGNRVLGPEYPVIARIKNWYIKQILIKIERTKSAAKAKDLILQCIENTKSDERFKYIQIIPDVDPM